MMIIFIHFHCRSVVGIVDFNGDSTANFEYDPFGNIIMQSGDEDSLFKFSGQYGVLHMKESGFQLMRTRLYSSQLGRFVSPDLFGYSGSPTNLYVFAHNNPLLYADPTGTIPVFLVLPLISGAISVGVYVTANLLTNQPLTAGGFVGSFLGGAVSGIPAVSALSPFLSGAIGGAVADITTQLIDNEKLSDFDVSQTLSNTLVSGLANGIFDKIFNTPDFATNAAKMAKKFLDYAFDFGKNILCMRMCVCVYVCARRLIANTIYQESKD